MNEMSAEELQEIVRRVLDGLNSGDISAASARRVSDAALLVVSGRGQSAKRNLAYAVLREAYEKLVAKGHAH